MFERCRVADNLWQSLPARYPGTVVDAFVVMPNHVHGIIEIVPNAGDGAGNDGGAIGDGDDGSAIGTVGAIHELPLRPNPPPNEIKPPYPNPPPGQIKPPHSAPWDAIQRRTHRRRMLLPMMVGYYKMNVSKRLNRLDGLCGVARWQRNYYEHVVRNEDDLRRIRQYIAENPEQWEYDCFQPKG